MPVAMAKASDAFLAKASGPVAPQAPAIATAGGPFTCKNCKPEHYFGLLVGTGSLVPVCPNCKKPTTPVGAA